MSQSENGYTTNLKMGMNMSMCVRTEASFFSLSSPSGTGVRVYMYV
jgi:hypothetical protein